MSSNVLPFGKRSKLESTSPLVNELVQSGAFSSEKDAAVWLATAIRKAWSEVRANPPSGGRDLGSPEGATAFLKEIGQTVDRAPAIVEAVRLARAHGTFR